MRKFLLIAAALVLLGAAPVNPLVAASQPAVVVPVAALPVVQPVQQPRRMPTRHEPQPQ